MAKEKIVDLEKEKKKEERRERRKEIWKSLKDNAGYILGYGIVYIGIPAAAVILGVEADKASKKKMAEETERLKRVFHDDETGYIFELNSSMSNEDIVEFDRLKNEENLTNVAALNKMGKM